MYGVELYIFNNADPFNLSWVIVVRKKVLILHKVLNDRSASHDVTGSTMMQINIFLTSFNYSIVSSLQFQFHKV